MAPIGKIDIFAGGKAGSGVFNSWWSDGKPWSSVGYSWARLGESESAIGHVTAISRAPYVIDLFGVGNDGRVYTSWHYEGQVW